MHFFISREAQLFVGWVSGSVTHAGVGFHASTQPTFIFNSTHLLRVCGKKFFLGVGCGVWGVGFYQF
ncbi:MAG: hypothetical protein EWV84_08195 [Microcystis sp. M_QC_C_20170808_M3Col]|nr:MAG: hypothetical protein EWV84_08195 [Microcystis sp. M_QC_C_20170808_M3Col]